MRVNSKELSKKIKDLLIVRENDGSYNLFGKYIIKPSNNGLYELTLLNEDTIKISFSSLKNAVTWCVFEKNNKYKEIKHIQDLDNLIGSLEVHIAQYKNLAIKTKDRELKDIYMAKLFEDKLRKKQAVDQLNSYVAWSKYWQEKKFEENQAI